MDELSTPPIPEPFRAGDQRQLRPRGPRHQLEKRLREPNREIEANELDEPVENHETEHHVDISV